MGAEQRLHAGLRAAVIDAGSALEAADRLCVACVDLLAIDGASISVVHEGATRGTFGSSSELSRRLDDYQFTFGEGPCMDAVRDGAPVLAPDLAAPGEHRWPFFRGALLELGVAAVFALPVAVSTQRVGALDLFRRRSGGLTGQDLTGGLIAADLAAGALLDLMTGGLTAQDQATDEEEGDTHLGSLERVEVYQATGMIMEALGVGPTEALVRLRAQAIAAAVTASELAWSVVERRVSLAPADWLRDEGDCNGPAS